MTLGRSEAEEEFHEALLDDDPVQLYERAPCGYLTTSPDGTIIKVNQTFLTWTGHDRDELVGRRRFVDLLNAGGRIYHETHYAPMLRMHGKASEIALDVVTADGGRLPVLLNAVLERDPSGEPWVVRLAVFDATDRREYERELLRAKQRAETSEARARALATTLQQTLIPPTPPVVPGLDVAAAYRPAGTGEEVGGDFYDVFQIAEDDWVVVLGDVCGKGVDAAVVTALVRFTVRAVTVQQPGAAAALHALNDILLRHRVDRFSTVVLVRLRRRDGRWTLTLSSGGHPLPLLLSGTGRPTAVGEPGTLVGVFDQPRFTDVEVVLDHGDGLLLYTDGVTEGRGEDGFYGDQRLHDVLSTQRGPAADVAAAVLDSVLRFQGGRATDDIALVVVRVPEAGGA
jgi:sigma-B regulation protein RsbU (phosphoserine phosphatase)